jgi:hypothetical protein
MHSVFLAKSGVTVGVTAEEMEGMWPWNHHGGEQCRVMGGAEERKGGGGVPVHARKSGR